MKCWFDKKKEKEKVLEPEKRTFVFVGIIEHFLLMLPK